MTVEAPPQNLEAEESVLGAVLLSERALEATSQILGPRDFYRASHGHIYAAALELRDAGVPIDAISLTQHLHDTNRLEDVGGRVRIHELAALVPAAGNAPHYARIVREHALRRRVDHATAALREELHAGLDSTTAIAKLATLADDLAREADQARDTVISAYQAAEWYAEKLRNPPAEDAGVPSPFSFLSPMQGGRLYVLGGLQGEGKTVIAIQAIRAAARAGKNVGVYTIEMGWRDLTDRLISCAGLPYQQVVAGRFSNADLYARAERAIGELATQRIDLIDDPWIDPAGIRQYARAGHYDLLVIDHLHQLAWTERRDLENAVRFIAGIARELEIPILLLAQLKRPGDSYPRPTMSAFRDTGMIEALAAACWLIHRPRDTEGKRGTVAELVVAKNRYGPEGVYPLAFQGDHVRFTEPPNMPTTTA